MGSASSKTEVDTAISSFLDVANNTAQSCSATTNASNLVNIGNIIAAGDIDIGPIGQKNVAVVSTSCLQKASTDTTVDNQFKQTASQQATAISDFLSLSSTKSEDINRYTLNLAESIKNSYLQTCSTTAANTNAVNIGVTPQGGSAPIISGGSVVIAGIDQQNIIQALTNCAQNTQTVIDARTALEQAIDQQATSQSRGPLSFLNDLANAFGNLFKGFTGIVVGIVILIVILAVIGLVIYFVVKATKKNPTTGTASPAGQAALLAALTTPSTPSGYTTSAYATTPATPSGYTTPTYAPTAYRTV